MQANRALRRALFVTQHGNVSWDGILRGTGVLALLGIPAVMLLPIGFGGLAGFVLVSIWVNGPLGIFLPATYEPILMLFGRLYPPVLVGFLGILGVLYVEFLNYHLYSKLLHLEAFRVARQSRAVSRVVRLFDRAPFFTVWLCSWSPLPYWTVRLLGPLTRYPIRRYLLATFLGRFPRLWFFAALGTWWAVDLSVLVIVSLASIAVAVVVFAWRRFRITSARRETLAASSTVGV
jgi:uncharacterized membrane protein YdjX (TVP38/TMEM64 family)